MFLLFKIFFIWCFFPDTVIHYSNHYCQCGNFFFHVNFSFSIKLKGCKTVCVTWNKLPFILCVVTFGKTSCLTCLIGIQEITKKWLNFFVLFFGTVVICEFLAKGGVIFVFAIWIKHVISSVMVVWHLLFPYEFLKIYYKILFQASNL